jgi:hypothetical protein
MLLAENKGEGEHSNHSRQDDGDFFGWFSRFARNMISGSFPAKEYAIVCQYRGNVANL